MARRRNDYYDDDRDYRSRRRSTNRRYDDDRSYRNRSSNSSYRRRRKSDREARIERLTWGLLVLVFLVVRFLPASTFANWMIPFSGALILIGSGFYQYSNRYRVSPITWMAGAVLALFAYYSFQSGADMTAFSLITFAAIIILGLVTGET